MKDSYYNLIISVKNFHKNLLQSIKFELNRLNIEDINNIQAFLIYDIGDKVLSIGDLTNHGYYFGTNASYNLRLLVENGYLLQEVRKHDRRSSEVKITQKSRELCEKLDHIFEEQAKFLKEKGIREDKVEELIATLSLFDKNLRNKR